MPYTANFRCTPNLSVSIHTESMKDVARMACEFRDALGQTKCGACGSPEITLIRRTPKGYEFFGWRCECGAQLDLFSPSKESTQLIPSRRDKQGNDLQHGGWVKYQREQPAPQQGDAFEGGF